MKCVILCAGYATRLYPLTLNRPKALLPIKNKPLLNYLLDKINLIEEIDEVFIITNNKFYEFFLEWAKHLNFNKKLKVINDKTKTNEDRLGGLGDLKFVLDKEKIKENLIVLAGDILFDFNLEEIINFFKTKNKNTLGLYDIKDISKAGNFGILEINENNRITSFEEKPANPKSTLVSTAIYLYTKKELNNIEEYMKTDKPKEGLGYLVPYFMNSQEVYGYVLEGNWDDIGNKEVYEKLK